MRFKSPYAQLLGAAVAASAPTVEGTAEGSRTAVLASLTARRVVMLKWLGALRLMFPGLILAFTTAIIMVEMVSDFWQEMLAIGAYMLAAGAAAASSGVALWTWLRTSGLAVISAIVVWSFVNTSYVMLAWAVPSGCASRWSFDGQPVSWSCDARPGWKISDGFHATSGELVECGLLARRSVAHGRGA